MDLYDEAAKVLDDTTIEKVLGTFGTVQLEGSYTYHTMVDRDIDFTVRLPENVTLSYDLRTKITTSLISLPTLRYLKVSDPHHFPSGARHQIDGFWFGLMPVSTVTNERWNLDIWVIPHNDTIATDTALVARLQSLTDDERATIVAIKQAARDAKTKEKGTTSFKIYDAVLNHGVATYEEFVVWLKK